MAEAADPTLRAHFANYDWAVSWHVEQGNLALAGYVSALGISQVTTAGTPLACFRRERDWQSAWMVRELRVGLSRLAQGLRTQTSLNARSG